MAEGAMIAAGSAVRVSGSSSPRGASGLSGTAVMPQAKSARKAPTKRSSRSAMRTTRLPGAIPCVAKMAENSAIQAASSP